MLVWLMQNAVIATVLAALVAVVCRVFRPPPAIGHALWLVVLVKLVVPPLPLFNTTWLDRWVPNAVLAFSSVPAEAVDEVHPGAVTRHEDRDGTNDAKLTNIPVLTPGDEWASAVASLDAEALREERPDRYTIATSEVQLANADPSDQAASDLSGGVPTASSVLAEPFISKANEEQAPATIPVKGMLFAVWTFGTFVVLVRHGVRIARLRMIVQESTSAPEWLVRSIAVQSLRFRLKLPRARVGIGLRCPMVVALPHATLLWPADLELQLGNEASNAVIAHELAHLKRCDHLTAWLEVAVTCLWWWHPVVWLARREMREYAELACDAYVVAQSPAARSLYAKALVDVCEFISQAKIAAAPAVGMARGNRRSFERRLTMILSQRISTRMPLFAWVGIVAVALLVLPSFSTGQDGPKQPETNATKAATESEPVTATGTTIEVVRDAPAAADELPTVVDTPAIKVEVQPRFRNHSELPTELRANSAKDPVVRPMRVDSDPEIDEDLTRRLRGIQSELQSLRGSGKKAPEGTVDRVARTLGELVARFRSHGAREENVIKEVFAWILGRLPSDMELDSWREFLVQSGHDGVESFIGTLMRSLNFTDARAVSNNAPIPYTGAHARPQSAATQLEPHRSKQPKVQSLLRVTYQLPADKGRSLANFLTEKIREGIDIRLGEHSSGESTLVVTAEGDAQRTIAGIVSLITGEPISRHIADAPSAATGRLPDHASTQNATGGMIYSRPAISAARPQPQGVFPPSPAATKATSSSSATVTKEPNAPYRRSTTSQEPSTDYRTERTTPGNLPGTVSNELQDQNPPAAK